MKSKTKEQPPEPKVPQGLSLILSFMDIDNEEIARQLTLIDFESFSAIKVPLSPFLFSPRVIIKSF